MKIQDKDTVLLLSPDNKTFLVRVNRDEMFSSHLGMIEFNDVIGKSPGDCVSSKLGCEFYILEPTVEDMLMKVKRLTQIVYTKDAAFILFKTGIKSGSRVIETGLGSGAMTIAIANAVYPRGKVYTYEKKQEFIDNAAKNIENAGLSDLVEYNLGDVRDGFRETDVDCVILDLPFPWAAVPNAYSALSGGGRIASISPTYNQVEKTVESLNENGFVNIESLEIIMRNLQVNSGRTRPRDRMVGHTGFLTFARKGAINDS